MASSSSSEARRLQPVDLHESLHRPEHAGDHVQQGRLAHSVGPEHGHQFAMPDLQIDLPQHGPHAVMMRDIDNTDHSGFSKDR